MRPPPEPRHRPPVLTWAPACLSYAWLSAHAPPGRFDRASAIRIPFLSAMAMAESKHGERGSYPEIVVGLTRHGLKRRPTCAFSKRYPPENYVIGALSDSLKLMADGSFNGFLQCGRGSVSALTSCWNLLSCIISLRCCYE